MKGSPYQWLQNVPHIILAAGHGGRDSGACNGQHREADQAILMVDVMSRILGSLLPAGTVIVAPHEHDTHETIPWINARYPHGTAWALEIHRDSADTIRDPDASYRCGVYHHRASQDIAAGILTGMTAAGAARSSWARDQRECRFGSLGWINQVHCLSHLIELGFMEGQNDPAHLHALASIGAAGIYRAFTGASLPL